MSATSLPLQTTPSRNRLNGILFVALMAVAVVQLADLPVIHRLGFSPLVVGIVCGMLYGNFLRGTMPVEWNAGVTFAAKRLLRLAVAFYGLNISIQQIAAVGLPGLAVSISIVLGTLIIGAFVGQRLLGLDRDTALLTASGSAICGAAAVLAFESTLRSEPHKSAVAVATVVLFGTLSMFLYPVFYHAGWLHFADTQSLGVYIGATIHEVAQVVGAASNIDPATTEVATIVKMTRVVLMVPVLLVLGLWLANRSRAKGHDGKRSAKVPVPWFAVGFLALGLVNSMGVLPDALVTVVRRLDVFVLTMAMTAMGIETRFSQIRKAGPRVLVLGVVLYAWLIFGGYAIVSMIV